MVSEMSGLMVKSNNKLEGVAMFKILSKEYWAELRDFAVQSPPLIKRLCVVFILSANIAGTTPYPDALYPPIFLHIWTWSLLADVVFIFTMSLCFFMTLKVAVNAKSKTTYFLSPLLTVVLVPIGYAISWFFVCIGADFGGDLPDPWFEIWSVIDFILPVSMEMELENMAYLMFGYNGLWFPMLFNAVVIFSFVRRPSEEADITNFDESPLKVLFAIAIFLLFIVMIILFYPDRNP